MLGKCLASSKCFNPRTPCGVRHLPYTKFPAPEAVSIHALLAECDATSDFPTGTSWSFNPRTPCGVRRGVQVVRVALGRFQSTHSLRSATRNLSRFRIHPPVSIHALLAECDSKLLLNHFTTCSFNPRTPCGVRHAGFKRVADMRWFQSTHSLRSATEQLRHILTNSLVSIHALLAECDLLVG